MSQPAAVLEIARRGQTLVPAQPYGARLIEALPDTKAGVFEARIWPRKLHRNTRHNGMRWVLMELIARAASAHGVEWSAQQVHEMIKRGTGLCAVMERSEPEARMLADVYGKPAWAFRYHLEGGSTSFAAMDQAGFSEWWERRALPFVIQFIAPHLRDSPEWAEIAVILGEVGER